MSKLIIGLDPDSKSHGVAVYVDGNLEHLKCLQIMQINELLTELFEHYHAEEITLHIEDVCANNHVFMKAGRMDKKREAEAKARGRTLGLCQQAQKEVERVFEYYGIKIVKHKISKTWKKEKAQFQKITGWKGKSNEDTRSSAYFGWLGCKAAQ